MTLVFLNTTVGSYDSGSILPVESLYNCSKLRDITLMGLVIELI